MIDDSQKKNNIDVSLCANDEIVLERHSSLCYFSCCSVGVEYIKLINLEIKYLRLKGKF